MLRDLSGKIVLVGGTARIVSILVPRFYSGTVI